MSKKILWLDNDPAQIDSHVRALQDQGHEVMVVKTVSEGEKAIGREELELLILDIAIPTYPHEMADYPPHETDRGHKTGLVFYRRMKPRLDESGIPVLVLSVRMDRDVFDEFKRTGLPPDRGRTKFELRNSSDFLATVRSLLSGGRAP